jgi:hypothetical protein
MINKKMNYPSAMELILSEVNPNLLYKSIILDTNAITNFVRKLKMDKNFS